MRDAAEEKAAMAIKAAERPDQKDYAEGVISDEEYAIQNPDDPEVKTRVAQVITEQEIAELRKIAPGREIPVDEIRYAYETIESDLHVIRKKSYSDWIPADIYLALILISR